MHLPELGFVDSMHSRIELDIRDDGVDVLAVATAANIRHEQDAAQSGPERDAEAEHRDGERCGQGTIKIDAGVGREEREEEYGAGTGEGE